ncbi:MAG: flagellar hook-basal body complex protein FliE [Pedosphaera sp.]|jgi:flagellar hook-basal body complex protein FliE|nr:flagellar hook-basal body complex protein FliE [Pedosphaera sp.]
MIPVQMNPMASQGLAEMYRQQRAIMQQSQQISEAARTGNVDTLQGAQSAQATQAVQGVSFGDVLNQFVSEVNDKQIASGQAVNDLLSGKDIPLHQAMIAMQEAGVAFQLMVEVRNKLLEGYQELMRMQV